MSVLFSTLHPLIRTASTTSTRSISITAVNFKKSKLGKITTKPKQQRARDMTQSIAEGLAAIDQLALKAQRGKPTDHNSADSKVMLKMSMEGSQGTGTYWHIYWYSYNISR
jgi:hypothetical protein